MKVLLMKLYELQHSGAIFVLICELVACVKKKKKKAKVEPKILIQKAKGHKAK